MEHCWHWMVLLALHGLRMCRSLGLHQYCCRGINVEVIMTHSTLVASQIQFLDLFCKWPVHHICSELLPGSCMEGKQSSCSVICSCLAFMSQPLLGWWFHKSLDGALVLIFYFLFFLWCNYIARIWIDRTFFSNTNMTGYSTILYVMIWWSEEYILL